MPHNAIFPLVQDSCNTEALKQYLTDAFLTPPMTYTGDSRNKTKFHMVRVNHRKHTPLTTEPCSFQNTGMSKL